MAQIQMLDPATINKIAAGEVIERPASIVKELVENAIDAGASTITVDIRDGGISYLRVTDNGAGIAADQVEIAFLRHSTSKIERAEDLQTISSLGFRGEALASIAAVARVEILTRRAEDMTGVRYVIEGGRPQIREEIACPAGIRRFPLNTCAAAGLRFCIRQATISLRTVCLPSLGKRCCPNC